MATLKYDNKSITNKKLTNISAIFFDLDNTLIPTRKGDIKACKKLCEILQQQYGLLRDDAERTTNIFLRSFRSCPDNPETTLDSWRSYLWSQALPDHLKHFNMEIYIKWIQLRYKYLSITNEYDKLLKILRNGYRLALITNGSSNGQWEKINRLNLSQYFDCILVSSDLPWEKPHPNIFLAACNILDKRPNECLMIGDKLETDIQGGIEAKLGATIWIPLNHEQTDNVQPVPDFIVDNLCGILKYLPNCSIDYGARSSNRQRRHSQTTVLAQPTGSKRSHQYRRGLSLPDIDSISENSCDCS